MLIIFDLDDTLIDTSGSVTPFKMKECLKRFVAEGLPIPCFERAYQELLELNAKAYRSKDALVEFLNRFRGGSDLLAKGMEEMVKPLPAQFLIPQTPCAKEMLKTLAESHTLALVTGGHPSFQMEKLEKAGIDRSVFSNIAIPEDSVKKPFYRRLLEEFSLSPDEGLVCGDRVPMDLQPAFELGLTTVHMRWGRGKIAPTETWVHHAISDLSELKRIINT